MSGFDHGRQGFDPLAYELVAVIDSNAEAASDQFLWIGDGYAEGQGLSQRGADLLEATSGQRSCAHCGKRLGSIRYMAIALHKPSGEAICFGHTCAEEIGYADEFELALARQRKLQASQAASAALRAKRAEWTEAQPEAAAILDAYEAERGESFYADDPEADEFVANMVRVRRLYGALSEKQTAVVLDKPAKIAARAERMRRQAEEDAKRPPMIEGRQQLSGRFVTSKFVESDYGSTLKGLLLLDDGNKLWGTVPAKAEEAAYQLHLAAYEAAETNEERHAAPTQDELLLRLRITMTAAVEISEDDAHFGFYKRPTKVAAELIDEEAQA